MLAKQTVTKTGIEREGGLAVPRKKHTCKFLVFQPERITKIRKEKVEIQSW